MSPPRSKSEWKARIEPPLSTSLRAASDAIMRTDVVQAWVHEAAREATEGLAPPSGMQSEMRGYLQMRDALEERFPELVNAVDELTEGCGQLDLQWRPTNPTLSRVQVTFDCDFSVDLFVRLASSTPEAARTAIDTVADALPEGPPFPNRPNTATGLIGHDDSCVGVRVREQLGEDRQRRYRTVRLLLNDRESLDRLSEEAAANRLLQVLASVDSSAVD